jgi:hypothetical protein
MMTLPAILRYTTKTGNEAAIILYPKQPKNEKNNA